jgi:hypothetical protein
MVAQSLIFESVPTKHALAVRDKVWDVLLFGEATHLLKPLWVCEVVEGTHGLHAISMDAVDNCMETERGARRETMDTRPNTMLNTWVAEKRKRL